MTIILTGVAGFIASHTLDRLLSLGHRVIGVDNLNDAYPLVAKYLNVQTSLGCPYSEFERAAATPEPTWLENKGPSTFECLVGDLADKRTYECLRNRLQGDSSEYTIIHLGARAGIRPSIQSPTEYYRSNVQATQSLLEFAKAQEIRKFIFSSSSSVYGVNPSVPWSEANTHLMPISPYASTKLSCEQMGHVYHHLYGIQFTALRFFTVYGPRQRPDLAINKFARLIEAGEPIPVFGDGSTRRDYTFVHDIVDGILSCLSLDNGGFDIINLGNNDTVSLSEMIHTLEEAIGKPATIDRHPEQPGDVPQTWADISKARRLLNYKPTTPLTEGIKAFLEWQKANNAALESLNAAV